MVLRDEHPNTAGGHPLMADICRLKQRLDSIDGELAKHRGPASERQNDLLRMRRETLLEMRDAERAYWGD